MRRPELRSVEEVCREAKRIVVIDGVVDTTNIGAIFRSAAALGIDAVLLTRNSCDPLNRRAVRVSMGSIFLVSWTWIDGSLSRLGDLGFRTAAMALTDDSISIDDPVLKTEPKLAIIMGTEGDGLPYETISEADYVVRIPMSHSVDSLNVGGGCFCGFLGTSCSNFQGVICRSYTYSYPVLIKLKKTFSHGLDLNSLGRYSLNKCYITNFSLWALFRSAVSYLKTYRYGREKRSPSKTEQGKISNC